MAKNNNLTDFLTDVANAIREKEGTTEAINPQNFSSRVRAIAGLKEKEQKAHTTLDSFLIDLADTIREAEDSTEAINPQNFSSRIIALEANVGDNALPLYIEAINNISVSFSNTYQYSRDMELWTDATSDTSIFANSGDKIYFRASGLTATSADGIGRFTITDKCNVGGNIMSMIYGADYKAQNTLAQSYAFAFLFISQPIVEAKKLLLPATTLTDYCYSEMFEGCVNLISTPALPAITLTPSCYRNMFRECTSLVDAPALPATTLDEYCYYCMFQGCTSLANAPALPSLILKAYCYGAMFRLCSNLINAPALPATELADYCYYCMFYDCTSLVNAPALPATTLAERCYSYMFYNCTSLVNAPALPAITLAESCYNHMFRGCTSLNYIKAMFTTTPGTNYTYNWVVGVSPTGTFVKNYDSFWHVIGVNGIPEGWTIEAVRA